MHRKPLGLIFGAGVALAMLCLGIWFLMPQRTPPGLASIRHLPGPARNETTSFILDDGNAVRMQGHNHVRTERWLDISGNLYSPSFIRRFFYTGEGPDAPAVRVRLDTPAPTLKGRVEARGLKPNFAYQLKLDGDYRRDKTAFERIGYLGRWRLPGMRTNYVDDEYRAFPEKEKVEAYILFDFFVTDEQGNAIREFSLDSSLHVLWNVDRQLPMVNPAYAQAVAVKADNPAIYARPRPDVLIERICAQREWSRYAPGVEKIRLPAGTYSAKLVLTEESFHGTEPQAGYWHTSHSLPVFFEITPEPAAEKPVVR